VDERTVDPERRATAVLVAAAAAVIVTAGLRAAAEIVAPVVLALVLTLAVAPLGAWARRRGWPGAVATVLVVVAAYAIVAVLTVGLAYSVVRLAAVLPGYVDDAEDLVVRVQDGLTRAGLDAAPLSAALGELDLGKVTDMVAGLLGALLAVLGNLVFLVTLLFFLGSEAATWSRSTGPRLDRVDPGLAAALRRYGVATQRYLLVSAGFGLVVAVLDGVALWFLGIPLPWTWALLSFLTNFVPNVGFIIGVIPPAVLGLLEGGWRGLLAVVVVYSLLNVVVQTFIQPRVVGNAVNLGTALTFLSVAFWTFVLGPLGALLAVPMTLLARTLLIDVDPRAQVASLLVSAAREPGAERPGRERPAPGPPEAGLPGAGRPQAERPGAERPATP
jgi:predicted PurR-regulated permease PerM